MRLWMTASDAQELTCCCSSSVIFWIVASGAYQLIWGLLTRGISGGEGR
jgi:hypothetical protein